MNSHFTVLSYTGTGNSRYAARKIAAFIKGEHIDLNRKFKANDHSSLPTAENVVIVTPTYCWRIPRIVSDWVREVKFIGAKRVWFVMTCGGDISDAGRYNKALCEEKGLAYMGTAQIVMPENYIAMFSVPKEDECTEIIRNAAPVICDVSRAILSGEKLSEAKTNFVQKLKSGPLNPQFYKYSITAKPFAVGDKCISCGKCEALCPLNNIRLVNGRPKWGESCTHCMACISFCPAEAIEYGKTSRGKRRYHID